MLHSSKKERQSSLRAILLSILAGGIFSFIIIHSLPDVDTSEYLKFILFGGIMGLLICSIFIFMIPIMNRIGRSLPFMINLILSPIIYSIIVGIVYSLAFTLFIKDNESEGIQFLPHTVIFSLILLFLLNLGVTISRLLGQKVLFRLVLGTYHKPHREKRFIMFLDIVGSTTIAEKIGDEKFHSLLNDFFSDISEPVLKTQGEIYKYVGDEIIVTWKEKQGLKKAQALSFFFHVKDYMELLRGKYIKKYGMEPQFRAGLHFGNVIVGEMGEYKKEIALLGDSMNTAARIQGACSEYKESFLFSSAVREKLTSVRSEPVSASRHLGAIELRGKNKAVDLYSMDFFKEPV